MKTRLPDHLKYFPMLFALWLPSPAMALVAEDMVRLRASGYGDEDLLEMIAATRSEFTLSAPEVVYLYQAGVSAIVLQAMLRALPRDPAAGDAAQPAPLQFMVEDLELLVQNQVPESVVVTFIESRDMAFALDTVQLTALRNAGMGLDALQLLVEKNAAATPVPLAPPTYFYGRSGNTYSTYQVTYQDFHSPPPSVIIRSSIFDPWYAQGYHSDYYGYGYGYRPYVTYYYPRYAYGHRHGYGFGYPYWWAGYHDFQCPRGPHHHGHHRDRVHDRKHDRNHDQDGVNFHAGTRPDRDRGNSNSDAIFSRETTPATHTFTTLGTKPLYGRSASSPTLKATRPVATVPRTSMPVPAAPRSTAPGITIPRNTAPVKFIPVAAAVTKAPTPRPVVTETAYVPRATTSVAVSADNRSIAREAAAAGRTGPGRDDRGGNGRVGNADSSGRSSAQPSLRMNPR